MSIKWNTELGVSPKDRGLFPIRHATFAQGLISITFTWQVSGSDFGKHSGGWLLISHSRREPQLFVWLIKAFHSLMLNRAWKFNMHSVIKRDKRASLGLMSPCLSAADVCPAKEEIPEIRNGNGEKTRRTGGSDKCWQVTGMTSFLGSTVAPDSTAISLKAFPSCFTYLDFK